VISDSKDESRISAVKGINLFRATDKILNGKIKSKIYGGEYITGKLQSSSWLHCASMI